MALQQANKKNVDLVKQATNAEQNSAYVSEMLQKETAKVNELKKSGGGGMMMAADPEDEEARMAELRANKREALAKDEEVERLT